ncbi:diaminopimelate decarboxylase [Acidiferrobacter sp.]|jgi:diaminopimelate decarboxylase|uniref:diaminopimelate decarboxylase n=1 Tax=Acidiferrobacter sp. TaxID=1872107 RepID=UPI0026366619|nr:diaminopimelate decarboxylase [Acidiferrobacter sp.]
MSAFSYRDEQLCVEDVALADIVSAVGSPCYVYSRRALTDAYRMFREALDTQPSLICYAVKANGNLALLATLADLGAGFDIVSQGELERVLAAGGDPARVVFSGVGKTENEMRRALEVGIRCFNVESSAELARLNGIAGALGVRAPVSLRVNPDVDAGTHHYIATGLKENKFGIPLAEAVACYREGSRYAHLSFVGIDCHIGSQLTDLRPFSDALDRVLPEVVRLRQAGVALTHVDVGGGLGVRYRDECPPTIAAYVALVRERLAAHGLDELELILEPGRALVAAAGVLVTRIEYIKETDVRRFAIVDAGMNDLIRPALYGAWQSVTAARRRAGPVREYDVVGPVCESADVFGRGRPLAVEPGDILVIGEAGAYGFAMSSQYNARPRPAEVLVDGARFHVVRRRETYEDLMRGETVVRAGSRS